MKTFVLILSTFLFSVSLWAQTWAPIGAQWRYEAVFPGTGEISYSLITIDKDTVIAGQPCKQYSYYTEYAADETTVLDYVGYTFERNDSVFFWQQDTFVLRYDFSAQLGDTIDIATLGLLGENEPDMAADTMKIRIEDIYTVNMGADSVAVEFFAVEVLTGDFVYWNGGYYRRLGSIADWNPFLYTTFPIGLLGEARLRCYTDDEVEIVLSGLGCGFPSATRTLIAQEQLKLYPNPVKETLHLAYDIDLLGAAYQLRAADGQLLLSGQLEVADGKELDVSGLAAGIYFVELNNGKEQGMWKFVKL